MSKSRKNNHLQSKLDCLISLANGVGFETSSYQNNYENISDRYRRLRGDLIEYFDSLPNIDLGKITLGERGNLKNLLNKIKFSKPCSEPPSSGAPHRTIENLRDELNMGLSYLLLDLESTKRELNKLENENTILTDKFEKLERDYKILEKKQEFPKYNDSDSDKEGDADMQSGGD